ncbi:MAG: aldehyde dehydrogenase family protein [Bacteroidia bacterium]
MARVEVLKTYKIFIGGQFPRTESGRFYSVHKKNKALLANICLSSRKDLRNAVVAARKAQAGWAEKTAFNRSQILYRLAEMLETRKLQFISELLDLGITKSAAIKEVEMSVDRLIHYAGWCDKFQALNSSVNPVASSHFNFSVPEPIGVVGLIAPEDSPLIGLISAIAPIIAGGNTCVVLSSYSKPTCSISFAEIVATSDVPGGVINIITGETKELLSHFSGHMDINALVYCRSSKTEKKEIQENSVSNLKRIFFWNRKWDDSKAQHPDLIMDLQEIKTTWHPVDVGMSGGSAY